VNESRKTDCDVVVVGAGIAGLSAAAHLAQRGFRVVVLEQHDKPGGYYTSFVRQGVVFDISAHWTIDHERINGMLAALEAPPIDFVPHRHIGQYLWPRATSGILLVDDREAFRGSILEHHPTARPEAVDRLIELALEVDAEFRGLTLASPELLSLPARLLAAVQTPWRLRTFLRYARVSADELLHELFPGDDLAGLRAALYLLAPIPGIAAFGMLLYIAFALTGRAWVPRGGASQASLAFAEAASRRGADLRYGALATGVDVEGRKVRGVRLAGGDRLTCEAVVSAGDIRRTFEKLVDTTLVPESFRRKLADAPVSVSFVIVSLVLDREPASFGVRPMDAFLTDTTDLAAMLAVDDPDHGFYSVQFPEFREPGARTDRYGLQILAQASFGGARWGLDAEGERGDEYAARKREFAERLLARAERFMPGLRHHVVEMDVATPITMHRYTLNDLGSPIGWSYTSKARWKQRVPFLEGLYLAGHWVGPSGIYNVTVSGRNAAELVARDFRHERVPPRSGHRERG
jgi:phytoene dehydrogenase-like protein